MINVIVAYDDNDSELGDYFEISFEDLNNVLSKIDYVTIKSIRGLDCTQNNVLKSINSFKENSFGFVGLSHGNESQLLTDNDVYVDADNVSHFSETLFYSTACSSAIELGEELIRKGCHSYVGFNQDSSATFEDFYSIYVECENYCLKEFLSSDKTLRQSFDNMLDFFDKKIDELFDKHGDEVLVAMELNDNKDSFVLFGNEELKKTDLEK